MTCGRSSINSLARKDRWPHFKVIIFLKNDSPITFRALFDTRVEASLIYGNLKNFKRQKNNNDRPWR